MSGECSAKLSNPPRDTTLQRPFCRSWEYAISTPKLADGSVTGAKIAYSTLNLAGSVVPGDMNSSGASTGNEPSHFEYAPFAAVETMIKGFHNVGDDEGDSVQAWIEGVRYGNHAVVDHWHHVTDASIVSVEIGMNYPVVRDTVLRNDSNVAIQPDGFGRRWPKLPSIKEHNGLRFTIPLLRLTPGDIRDYEQVLQTLAGRYIPGEYAREFSERW